MAQTERNWHTKNQIVESGGERKKILARTETWIYNRDVILLLGLNAISDTKSITTTPQNSEFMEISGRLTGMKAMAVNFDYFTD